jgi:hypothetical protein
MQPFVVRYPNLKSVRELVYKRGYAKINGSRIPITDNSMIESKLGMKSLLSGIVLGFVFDVEAL